MKQRKSLSSYEKGSHKELKTQRTSKEENDEQERRREARKKYSKRKSSTEPNEDRFHKKITCNMKQSYIVPRVINEVE